MDIETIKFLHVKCHPWLKLEGGKSRQFNAQFFSQIQPTAAASSALQVEREPYQKPEYTKEREREEKRGEKRKKSLKIKHPKSKS